MRDQQPAAPVGPPNLVTVAPDSLAIIPAIPSQQQMALESVTRLGPVRPRPRPRIGHSKLDILSSRSSVAQVLPGLSDGLPPFLVRLTKCGLPILQDYAGDRAWLDRQVQKRALAAIVPLLGEGCTESALQKRLLRAKKFWLLVAIYGDKVLEWAPLVSVSHLDVVPMKSLLCRI